MADVASLVFDIDSTQAAGAARELLKLESAAGRAATGAAKLETTYRGADGRFRSAASAARENAREIETLAGKYNTGMAAQLAYARAQGEVARAVQLGVVAADQKDAVLERLSAQYLAASGAAQRYAGAMAGVNNIQGSVGNQFAQLNDVVVTAWGGMNPALIGMQQGMQMVQGFAGQSLPQALGTLRGAFAQLLNPTTLVTIGAVALGAAIIQAGTSLFSSSSDAKTFGDALGDAESAIADINKASMALSSGGLDELGKKYGTINQYVRELVENQRIIAVAEGVKQLNSALGMVTETLGSGLFNSAYGDIESAFKVGSNEAQVLYGVLNNIKNLKSLDLQLVALREMKARLSEVTAGFTNMTPKQAEVLKYLVESEDQAMQLKAAVDRLPGSFAAAASAASRITDELNKAVSAAARLANSAISDARFAQIELDYRTDKIGRAAALAAAKFDEEVGKKGMDQWLYNSLRQQAIDGATETARIMSEVDRLNEADREVARKDKGAGGAAARELKAAEKGFQTIRELLEKESMFQIAEWEKRQAQLDAAYAKRLLSEENYHIMKQQLQMMYFGIEAEQNLLRYQMDQESLQAAFDQKLLTEQQYLMKRAELQHQYYSEAIGVDQNGTAQRLSQMSADFAQMNSLAGGGYDSLLRLQKTFAAGSALINAYLAASQALADPTISTWAKFAAYAKVLAAGIGLVNAIKGTSASSSGKSSASASAAKAEPTKNILVRLEGPDFMVDMAEDIIKQIYESSKDGRVIIARDVS